LLVLGRGNIERFDHQSGGTVTLELSFEQFPELPKVGRRQ